MTKLLLVVSMFCLVPISLSAQVRTDFVGKWVVDVEKMAETDPDREPPPYPDRFISTGFWSGHLRIQGSAMWVPGFYDPSGKVTMVALGEDQAIARSRWDDDRLVVRIEVAGRIPVVTRTILREGRWLVIEDRDEIEGSATRTYFVKS